MERERSHLDRFVQEGYKEWAKEEFRKYKQVKPGLKRRSPGRGGERAGRLEGGRRGAGMRVAGGGGKSVGALALRAPAFRSGCPRAGARGWGGC